MAALPWDPTSLKAHLRFTSQRLSQLQAKLDSEGNVTRKDIATLLQQGNVCLARAKAQKLVQEDAKGDLLGVLEMEVSTLLEHFTELDANAAPTPLLTGSVASIIYAAPQVQCKELDAVRSTLIQRFGPEFAEQAAKAREVPGRVLRCTNAPTPTASLLNQYLASVAKGHNVNWVPNPDRQDIVNYLAGVLNPELTEEIDMENLRKICAYGLPDVPTWIRPRVWKSLFNILPSKPGEWAREMTKQRECYYDLVKRLLQPYASLEKTAPAETEALDEALLNIFKHLSRIPREIFAHLEAPPQLLPHAPLSPTAEDAIKIGHAYALDARLKALRERDTDNKSDTSGKIGPSDNDSTPGVSLSNYDNEDGESNSPDVQTLIESKPYSFGNAHYLHCSAILRLLFIHASINPGKLSPHVPALLVPLYTALLQEVEPEDLAHVEADAFWLFEAIVSETSELDEEDGGQKWMTTFDSVVAWADPELHNDLQVKDLQPALPHYSYRWLAPLLTYTIPVPAILVIWDAIFARLPRDKDVNFKLDFLVDISSAMLMVLRNQLLNLGKSNTDVLWNADTQELGKAVGGDDVFLEGISMLQAYPLNSIEDADRIIQIANDLYNRREMEKRTVQPNQAPGFGARLATTMWKGFTNQIDVEEESSPNTSDSEKAKKEDGYQTERPSQGPVFNLTSVLGSFAGSAKAHPVPPKDEEVPAQASQPVSSGLWNYAEKLKDSDTVASLAKISTNWRARAATVTDSLRRGQASAVPAPEVNNNGQSHLLPSQALSGVPDHTQPFGYGDRRLGDHFVTVSEHSNPEITTAPRFYSSPTRPENNGYWSSSSTTTSSSMTPPISAVDPSHHETINHSFVDKTKNLLSIAVKSPTGSISKRSPRPLLLNSASPITSPPARSLPPSDSSRAPDYSEWSEVMKMKKQLMNRQSMSSFSASSHSPSEAPMKSARSDWDSDRDTGSRIVPLNRRSVSPMSPAFRAGQLPKSRTSSIASVDAFMHSNLAPSRSPLLSPPSSMLFSIPQQYSPTPQSGTRRSLLAESHQEMTEEPEPSLDAVAQAQEFTQRQAALHQRDEKADDTSDSAPAAPTPVIARQQRVRSKKNSRPTNLRLRSDSNPRRQTSAEQKSPNGSVRSSNLTVDWPQEDDMAATPRASYFDDAMVGDRPRQRRPSSARKSSTDAPEGRPARKPSSSSTRSRKISSSKDARKSRRESAADDGDDEGYDDLLSAYESEDA